MHPLATSDSDIRGNKPASNDHPRFPWVRLLLHPAHSLPTAAAPVIIGSALAIHDHVFSFLPALLGLIASWLIHVGGLYTENYWLLTRYWKLREHPELADAVANGSLPLSSLRRVAVGCFLCAIVTGAYLVTYAGIMAPVLGIVGVTASLSYCASTKRGIGELVFFTMFGVIAVAGTYYTQAAQFYSGSATWGFVIKAVPLRALVLGMPLGAIITDVMLVDDLSDITVDRAKGWQTRPVVWGVAWARREYVAFIGLAYGLPFWFWLGLGFHAWILLPLLTAPFAGWAIHQVYVIAPANVEPMSPKTAGIGFLYALLLSAGILLSG